MDTTRTCPAWLAVLFENQGRVLTSTIPASNDVLQLLRDRRATIHDAMQYLVSLWSPNPSWDNLTEQTRMTGILKADFMRHAHFLHDIILPEEKENDPATASSQLSQIRVAQVMLLENQVQVYTHTHNFRERVNSIIGYNVGVNEERTANGDRSLYARIIALFRRATAPRFDMTLPTNGDQPDTDVAVYNETEARETTTRICNALETGLYRIIMEDVTRLVYQERLRQPPYTTWRVINTTAPSQPRLTRTTHPDEEMRGILRFSDPDDIVDDMAVNDDDVDFSDDEPADVPQQPPYRYYDSDANKGKRPANQR
jgi:hypothetical protein